MRLLTAPLKLVLLTYSSVKKKLTFNSLNDLLLHSSFRNEAKYLDWFLLSKPVRPIHRLCIYVWIPITSVRITKAMQFLSGNSERGLQRILHTIFWITYLSNRITISAVAKLIPSPPARVLSKKANLEEPSALNSSICESRFSPSVFPSMRQYSKFNKRK